MRIANEFLGLSNNKTIEYQTIYQGWPNGRSRAFSKSITLLEFIIIYVRLVDQISDNRRQCLV